MVKYQVPEMSTGSLPRECLETIRQCDTVFMAARHLAATSDEVDDMDVNHRGGTSGTPPVSLDFSLTAGYVRVETDGRTLILPDYSGNLFYTTIGSIESDRNIPIHSKSTNFRSRGINISKLLYGGYIIHNRGSRKFIRQRSIKYHATHQSRHSYQSNRLHIR